MILTSACLAGMRCRYDARIVPNETIVALVRDGKAIPVCPEMLGGLACPRVACEVQSDGRVCAKDGTDRTEAFERGAEETLRLARLYGADRAILKSKSPSCGCGRIYDGTFSGTLIEGDGVTAKLLKKHGITVETID